MKLEELRILLDYHYWARDRLLEAVQPASSDQYAKDLGNSFPSIRDTLVHIYAAEWGWYSRWQGASLQDRPQPEDFPDLQSLRKVWREMEVKMRAFLEDLGEEGVDRLIEIQTIDGKTWKPVFWNMLQHVINHATYHRGQVTTMLRQLRLEPPKSMDLISFYRERG